MTSLSMPFKISMMTPIPSTKMGDTSTAPPEPLTQYSTSELLTDLGTVDFDTSRFRMRDLQRGAVYELMVGQTAQAWYRSFYLRMLSYGVFVAPYESLGSTTAPQGTLWNSIAPKIRGTTLEKDWSSALSTQLSFATSFEDDDSLPRKARHDRGRMREILQSGQPPYACLVAFLRPYHPLLSPSLAIVHPAQTKESSMVYINRLQDYFVNMGLRGFFFEGTVFLNAVSR